jgi:hypothetical protein
MLVDREATLNLVDAELAPLLSSCGHTRNSTVHILASVRERHGDRR